MSIFDWVKRMFGGDKSETSLNAVLGDITKNIYYKSLAVEASINMISNAVARSEFQTYEKGIKVKKSTYYLFNIEPNQNKSSAAFWRDVIRRLVYDGEALIIQPKGSQLYLADSFLRETFGLVDNIYKEVVVNNYKLNDTFYEREVIYLEMNNQKVRKAIDGIYEDYSSLISLAKDSYKRDNNTKLIMEMDSHFPLNEESKKGLDKLFDKDFRKFLNPDKPAVLQLQKGLSVKDLSDGKNKSKSQSENRDVRKYIDDIFDYVAISFGIPPSLLKGDTVDTKDAINNFLTFCVNPIAETIEDEINRKLYQKKEYLGKNYTKLDTSRVKTVDIRDIANSLDILVRNGAYTVNDCLTALGLEPINNEIGEQRFITKNYETVENMIKEGSIDEFEEVI